MNSIPFAGPGFGWLLQTSWQAAVLVLLVLVVQMVFRSKLSPSWRYGLWFLVIVRLLMPAPPKSALSVFNLAKFPSPDSIATASPISPERTTGPRTTTWASPFPLERDPRNAPFTESPNQHALGQAESAASGPPAHMGAIKSSQLPNRHLPNWLTIAYFAWLIGVCLLAVRLVWGHFRFSSRLAQHAPVREAAILRLVEDCSHALGVRQPIAVIETAEIWSPAVCGFWRKTLLLPDGVFERFSSEELRHIFLHELAHVKRRDVEVNWLVGLLQILHWFNPVLWLAFARMRADREIATDALALVHVGSNANARYGETIVRVVEHLLSTAAQPGLVGIAESKAQLKERIRAIARSGASKPWRWMASGVAVVLAGVGLTGAQQSHQAPATGASGSPINLESSTPTADQTLLRTNQGVFVLRVSDSATGGALSGVNVGVTLDYFGATSVKKEGLTDRDGRISIRYALADLKRLAYDAQKTDYVSLQGEWFSQTLPADECQITLGQGTLIGGIVTDESGNPVKDAEISFDEEMNMILSGANFRAENAQMWRVSSGQRITATAADGSWKAKCIREGIQWACLRVHHPDFADTTCSTELTGAMAEGGKGVKVSFEDLRKSAVRLVLTKGLKVSGHVTDETGAPLPGIPVTCSELLTSPNTRDQLKAQRTANTDAQGKFQFDHVPQRHLLLLVQTTGYAPEVAEVDPKPSGPQIELKLAKGVQMSGVVKDKSGEPVSDVHVSFSDFSIWRGVKWEVVTDKQGHFVWDHAPTARFQLQFAKDGFIALQKNVTVEAGKESSFSLNRALHILGKVEDAETGKPIKAFRIGWSGHGESGPPGFRGVPFRPMATIPGSDGAYTIDVGRLHADNWFGGYAHQCVFHLEADGYAPFVSRTFSSQGGDVGDVVYDVQLKAAPQVFGTVLGPDDRPVAGAQVAFDTRGAGLVLSGAPSFSGPAPADFRLTDGEGRVHLNAGSGWKKVVAVHAAGFAMSDDNPPSTNFTLKLQPWGKIGGMVWEYDRPVTNQEIWANGALDTWDEGVRTSFRTNTDPAGHFVMEFVPPGKYALYRMIPMANGASSGSRALVQVEAGKTASVKVGGAGQPVVGRVKIANPYVPIDWQNGRDHFYARSILPQPPPDLKTREAMDAWRKQPQIQQVYDSSQNYPIQFAADGSFRIDEVVPGNYSMQLQILDPRDPSAFAYQKFIANTTKTFEVPQANTREPLDIGVVEITLKPDLKSGQADAPGFDASDLKGGKFKLSDYRGKYVLLDFWATWCGPCIGEIPYLKQVHEKFKGRDNFVMISLSLDKTLKEPGDFLKNNDLPWVQGYLGEWSTTKVPEQYGVQGIPAVFLVNPDGKIIEADLQGSSMIATLEKDLK
jgi:beta-lactamase regulating signal transducer with metallopeptidase domain/thiol-disulfide isomerase/thioredoxin